MKEEEDPSEEAFDAAAFAQLVSSQSRREARAVLLTFRVPGNNGDGSQHGVDPGDELEAPIACIQADHAGM
jgi:hypothetical protein